MKWLWWLVALSVAVLCILFPPKFVAGPLMLSLAVGMLGKSVLPHFVAGFVLPTQSHLKLGQMVELPSVKTIGEVIEQGQASSKILTLEKMPLSVPNSLLIDEPMYNLSLRDGRQHALSIFFAPQAAANIPSLSRKIRERLLELEEVDKDAPILSHLNSISLRGLELRCVYYSHPSDYPSFQQLTLCTIGQCIEEEGLSPLILPWKGL